MRKCKSCGRKLKGDGASYCLPCNPTRLAVARLCIEKTGLPIKVIANMLHMRPKTVEYYWQTAQKIIRATS